MTATTTVLPFVPRPLPAPIDESALAAAEVLVADGPGHPCRRCLRDAAPGETVLLLTYDPWLGDSPYRQPGPVFVHAGACAYEPGDELPDQLTSRLLSVRGFDERRRPTRTAVVPGSELADTAGRLLRDGRTEFVHVHFAGPGCFAVRLDRAPEPARPGSM